MEQSISQTRIVPPKSHPDLLLRDRVRTTLKALLHHRLILVTAPPGYGKTAALLDLGQTLDWHTCWYAVGTTEQSPYRFIAHFVAAIERRFPSFGAEAKAALATYATGQSDIEQIATIVANDLIAHVSEPFLFVIDDYHLVDENFEIGQFVTWFVQQVGDTCHLLLSSRKLLNLPGLPLLAARGYVGGLDTEDLKFQTAELQTLARQSYGMNLDGVQARQLIKGTEGWITGLLLLAQTNQWHTIGPVRQFRAPGAALYQYLTQRLLDQQPASLRDFLLRTAYLDELSAELCADLLGEEWRPSNQNWCELLHALSQHNLQVQSVGETATRLRYHHLFQEFLQKKLTEERPTEKRQILLRLLALLKRRKQWDQAYQIALRLDDSEILADLVEEAGMYLLQKERLLLAKQWLDAFTPTMLETRPKLTMLQGYTSVLQGDAEHGLELLERSVAALAGKVDPLALTHTLILQSVAHRLLGQYPAASIAADLGLEKVEQYDHRNNTALGSARALALRSKGLSSCSMGRLSTGISLLQESLTGYQRLGDLQNEANLCMDLGTAYATIGEHVKSMTLYERALHTWESQHNLIGQANVLNTIGIYYHQHGQYVEALRALQRGLCCAERSGYFRLEAITITCLADVFYDTGIRAAARALYQRAYATAQRLDESFLVLYLELAQANLARMAQDWGEVYRALDAAGKLVLNRNSVSGWALYRLAIGKMYLARDKPCSALEPLADASKSFEASGKKLDAAIAKLWNAVAHHRLGDRPGRDLWLHQTLHSAFGTETHHALIMEAISVLDDLRETISQDRPTRLQMRFLQEVEECKRMLPCIRRQLRRMATDLVHKQQPIRRPSNCIMTAISPPVKGSG